MKSQIPDKSFPPNQLKNGNHYFKYLLHFLNERLIRSIHFDLGLQFLVSIVFTVVFIYIGQIVISTLNPKDKIISNPVLSILKAGVGFGKNHDNAISNQILQKEQILSDKKESFGFIVSAVAIAGLFTTAKSIHDRNHQERLTRAASFATEWYSSEMKESTLKIRQYTSKKLEELEEIRKINKDGNNNKIGAVKVLMDLKNKNPSALKNIQKNIHRSFESTGKYYELKDHLTQILTFFENMSLDVRLGVADEEYLKELFFSVVIKYYELFNCYLNSAREKHGSLAYCNFVTLAHRWEQSLIYPDTPSGCPPVLDEQAFFVVSKEEDNIRLESYKEEDNIRLEFYKGEDTT
ncbi:DUF4760 domain-containing protein [Pseudanabaena sp. BC1403]|uniref:DUF4760 domain-containing protein n=1 Tax=Pseudanabaena sp. BC1403 TaxID=2043171 RepID=UPI0015E1627D|nr:DUF4760 domain-containing protein [Pseudanabaena sp. BC1403]